MATENIVYTTALEDGMPNFLAQAIVAQSKHETGNYTSKAFTKLNNLFGYSFTLLSDWQLLTPGFVADNGKPLGMYATLYDSVHEITHWILRRRAEGKFPDDLSSITTLDQYATLLKNSGYYGDTITNYLAGLKRWFSGNIAVISGGLLLVAAIGLAFYMTRQSG